MEREREVNMVYAGAGLLRLARAGRRRAGDAREDGLRACEEGRKAAEVGELRARALAARASRAH